MRVVGRLLPPACVVLAAAFVVSGCAVLTPTLDPVVPAPTLGVNPDSTSAASEYITFVSVVDGDTIETSAGTIRLIGIDTPERGECGDDEAAAAIESQLAPGDTVTLERPAGENDQDQYGRLIRYVNTPTGADLGLLQLQAGHAVARYDSTDGYPAHPREAEYHAAQLASLSPDGSVITVTCEAAAAAPPPAPTDRWWEQYSSCTKLKKNTVGHPTGPFNRNDPSQAEPYDWFANRTGNSGDGDGDGLACE